MQSDGAPTHLFIVAGYPASGKSTLLREAAKKRLPIFGEENDHALCTPETARAMHENRSTEEKLQLGFWCTLTDIPYLNAQDRLPRILVFHLDLMLAYLCWREARLTFPSLQQAEYALIRFFEQPAIARYDRVTTTTLDVSFEELQAHWSYRFRAGLPPNTGSVLAEKNTMFLESRLGQMACENLYAAWQQCQDGLAQAGKLGATRRFSLAFGTGPASGTAAEFARQASAV